MKPNSMRCHAVSRGRVLLGTTSSWPRIPLRWRGGIVASEAALPTTLEIALPAELTAEVTEDVAKAATTIVAKAQAKNPWASVSEEDLVRMRLLAAAVPQFVAWAAVIAGGVAAVAITVLLVALGTGIGLSSISPWTSSNPSATTFTLLAAGWLIIVQWLSSGLGGYLAGRLRTKWTALR
jgi:hypothetical protein